MTNKMGTTNEKWLNDLSEGEKGERVVAEFFKKRFGLDDISYNNNSEYDFKGRKDGRTIYFEVKTDRYEYFKEQKTFNMFIEITCSGKPSGILTSKADHFVYYYPDLEELYIIPMDELRMLCIKEEIQLTSMSGDGGRTEGYLVHRNLWKDKFKVYSVKKDTDIWKNK
jgi:hypothetical protein